MYRIGIYSGTSQAEVIEQSTTISLRVGETSYSSIKATANERKDKLSVEEHNELITSKEPVSSKYFDVNILGAATNKLYPICKWLPVFLICLL